MNTKKLKLTTLSEAILKNKESQAVRGGQLCTCSCFWQGTEEGASIEDNTNANYKREDVPNMAVTNICFGMESLYIGLELKKLQKSRDSLRR